MSSNYKHLLYICRLEDSNSTSHVKQQINLLTYLIHVYLYVTLVGLPYGICHYKKRKEKKESIIDCGF